MSASSSPTLRPRSRRPSARLSAVVDLPTPPLPDATAITAATPGISDCRDIGDWAPPCGGGLWVWAGCTPGVPRLGGGGGGGAEPALRSAGSATITVVPP